MKLIPAQTYWLRFTCVEFILAGLNLGNMPQSSDPMVGVKGFVVEKLFHLVSPRAFVAR